MRAPKLPCGAGCGRFLPPAGQRCLCIYGADELCAVCGAPLVDHQKNFGVRCAGPIECTCDSPTPDPIGECAGCRRRIIPEENAA